MSNLIPSGWRNCSFSDICNIVGGGTPERAKNEYWGGDIYWASPTEITKLKTRYITSTKEKITTLGLEKSSAKLLPIGTVLMTSRASIGYVAINTVPMTTNQGFQSLHCKDNVYNEFLYQYVTWIRPRLEQLSAGSTFAEISSTNVKTVKVVIPPLPEQQKIAKILTSVDEVIEKTQAQIDKLKDLKTGMMQELLTKGIGPGGVPHTEFKDSPVGRIPDGWEVSTLGESFELSSGSTPSRREKAYFSNSEDSIPWVKTLDMHDGLITKTDEKITKDAIDNSSCKILSIGTALIAMYGGWNQIGRSGVLGIESTTNQAICALKKKGVASGEFANYWLISKRSIWKSVAASSRKDPNITKQDVSNFLIALPPIAEQTIIVERLDSISNYISGKESAFRKYNSIKKALMQDLLTGKVRVNINV